MRVIAGIIWFFIMQFVLGMIGAAIITYNQRSMGVSRESITIPNEFDLFILIASLMLAIWGTISGKLPGTKKKTQRARKC